jgi:hypothetical protein
MATAALAVTGEYGNMCSMGLALGKDIPIDCSINTQLQGKTYCFGSKGAMSEFMKDPTAMRAQAYYSKKLPGYAGKLCRKTLKAPSVSGGPSCVSPHGQRVPFTMLHRLLGSTRAAGYRL